MRIHAEQKDDVQNGESCANVHANRSKAEKTHSARGWEVVTQNAQRDRESTNLPSEIMLERFNVLVKSKRAHRPKDIIPVDGLALLPLALVRSLRRDEAHKLRHAFLHSILAVLGDLSVSGECLRIGRGNEARNARAMRVVSE